MDEPQEEVMRFLKARTHGYIDYLAGIVLLALPTWLGFSETATTVAYFAAGSHLLLSMFTAYPLGAFKKIPFPVHGAIEIMAAVFLLVSPWLFGFSEEGSTRNAFVIFCASLALVWAVTDYRSASISASRYHFPESQDRIAA